MVSCAELACKNPNWHHGYAFNMTERAVWRAPQFSACFGDSGFAEARNDWLSAYVTLSHAGTPVVGAFNHLNGHLATSLRMSDVSELLQEPITPSPVVPLDNACPMLISSAVIRTAKRTPTPHCLSSPVTAHFESCVDQMEVEKCANTVSITTRIL